MIDGETSVILDALARTPAAVGELVCRLRREDHGNPKPAASPAPVSERTAPDSHWGVVHHVCHLRDIEREAHGVRIRRLLEEENPAFPGIDGSRLAIERNYASESLATAYAAFIDAREASLGRLRALTPAELLRGGWFSDAGQPPIAITLGKLVHGMLEHDREHLAVIRDLVGALCSPAP